MNIAVKIMDLKKWLVWVKIHVHLFTVRWEVSSIHIVNGSAVLRTEQVAIKKSNLLIWEKEKKKSVFFIAPQEYSEAEKGDSAFTTCKVSSCHTSPFLWVVLLLTQPAWKCTHASRETGELLKLTGRGVQKKDVLHSSFLASFWMAREQICVGWRNLCSSVYPFALHWRLCKCFLASLGIAPWQER